MSISLALGLGGRELCSVLKSSYRGLSSSKEQGSSRESQGGWASLHAGPSARGLKSMESPLHQPAPRGVRKLGRVGAGCLGGTQSHSHQPSQPGSLQRPPRGSQLSRSLSPLHSQGHAEWKLPGLAQDLRAVRGVPGSGLLQRGAERKAGRGAGRGRVQSPRSWPSPRDPCLGAFIGGSL